MNRELIVGISVSRSGRYAWQGQQALQGIRLWQLDAVSRGLSIRLIEYNDGSRTETARQNALRLIRDDRVDIVLGPYSGPLSLAAAEVTESHGKVLWNYGGSSDEIFERGFKNVIGILSPASTYLSRLPSWLAAQDSIPRKICAVYSRRSAFARRIVQGFATAAGVVGLRSSDEIEMAHQEEVLDRLASMQPAFVLFAGSFERETELVKQRHRWPASIVSAAAVAAGVNAFGDHTRELSEGIVGPTAWEPSVRFDDIRGPDAPWFVENFQARFRRAPEYIAAAAFAAGVVLEECIRRTGSLKDRALRQAAAALDLHTLYGRFRIDPQTGRQIGHRMSLVRWQAGRKVIIAPNGISETDPAAEGA